MVTIRLVIEGEVVLSRALEGIEARLNDLSGAWEPIVSVFRGIVARAFATEGGSTGAQWKSLADSTQADRRRRHFGPEHPILERTGTLRRSLTTDQGLGFTTKSPASLAIGTNVRYFKYHQSLKPRKKLPRRAPVLFREQDRQDLVFPIRLWITGRDPNGVRRAPAARPA